jgi:hypothetical protein
MAKRKKTSKQGRHSVKRSGKSAQTSQSGRPTQHRGVNVARQHGGAPTIQTLEPTETKIFPRNLTARAEFCADGNPIVTRPEDAIRVVATLRQTEKYPAHLFPLAQRIVADGMQHESRFITIKAALKSFGEGDYLRAEMRTGTPREAETALGYRDSIIAALKEAYTSAAYNDVVDCAAKIAAARETMIQLLAESERLANDENIGISFFERL